MKKVIIIAMALMLGSMSYGQDSYRLKTFGGGPIGFIGIYVGVAEIQVGNYNGNGGDQSVQFYADPTECNVVEVFIDPNVNSVITNQRFEILDGDENIIISEFITASATYIFQNDIEIAECIVESVSGCIDETACNYDETAVEDDGSCTFAAEGLDCDGNCLSGVAVVYTEGEYPGENLFTITNCESDILAIMLEGEASFNECVVLPEDYTIYLGDTYGDTWNGGTLSIDGVVYEQPTQAQPLNNLAFDTYEIGNPCIIQGCTDSSAINYNSLASEDDGSCLYEGCTDLTADNYDAEANTDDGSCVYCYFNGLDLVTLLLTDSYGDGWNGNNVSINTEIYSIFDANGEFTTDVEIQYEGGYSQTTDLCVDLSECIDVIYNNEGEYGPENLWGVFDSEGNILDGSSGYIGEVNGEPTFLLPESGTIGDCSVVGIGEVDELEDRGSFKIFNTMGQEIPLDKLPSNIVLIRIYENGSSEKFSLED